MIYILITLGVLLVVGIIFLVGYVVKNSESISERFRTLKQKRNENIGRMGEKSVNDILITLPGKTYSPYNVLNKEGKVRNIDHIFVNKTGVYVIETKTWSGRITGKPEDEKWYSHLGYEEEQVNEFKNPMYQNEGHVKLIKAILPTNAVIIPVVVFVNNNYEDLESDEVINLDELRKFILDPEEVMDEVTVNKIIEILDSKYVNASNEYIKEQNIKDHKN